MKCSDALPREILSDVQRTHVGDGGRGGLDGGVELAVDVETHDAIAEDIEKVMWDHRRTGRWALDAPHTSFDSAVETRKVTLFVRGRSQAEERGALWWFPWPFQKRPAWCS